MSGRPLRFLGGVVGLWTLGRIAVLLPSEPAVEMAIAPKRPAPTKAAPILAANLAAPGPASQPIRIADVQTPSLAPTIARQASAPPPPKTVADMVHEDVRPGTPPRPPFSIPALPETPTPMRRWSASVWGIVRDGGRTLLPGGQLGGTQAGIRLLRRLDSRGDLSASLRFSTPWQGIGREMAVGVDWRPVRRLPVRLLVEQRFAVDSGQNAPAVLIVTGIGPKPVAPGLTLTAYAQAGVVGRARVEPFADGAARIGMAVSPDMDLAFGAWGGAQRDAQRLDIGPSLGLALPVADRRIRLSLDWRQRVAGRAAPGSGPALTLASDF